MHRKKILLAIALVLVSFTGRSQTWLKDYTDIFDTVWQNSPNAVTYAPGHGAIISSSVWGSPGWGFYYYDYVTHVNNKGDSVWVKRDPLDSTFIFNTLFLGPDTVVFQGVVQSVIRLNGNGNYLLAGDNFGGNGFYIKQLDSNGNQVSWNLIYDTTYSETDRRSIQLVPADGNNFYVLYNADSIFYVPTGGYDSVTERNHIVKMDNNYNPLWSKLIYYNYNLTGGYFSSTYGLDVQHAFMTSDSGLAFIRDYDTTLPLPTTIGNVRFYLEKLRPDGRFNFGVCLDSLFGKSSYVVDYFGTHDSCIVASIYSDDGTGNYIAHLCKLNHMGAIVDSITYPHDTAVGYQGVELSTGKYLFASYLIPEFFTYDTALNFLGAMPYPFTENNFFNYCPMVANEYGGALCTFAGGNPSYMAAWHTVAVNFDSTFSSYPSFVTGSIFQDNNNDCVYNAGDLHIGGAVASLHDATTGDDFYGFTDPAGFYRANVPNGNYTVAHASAGYDINECGAYTYVITAPVTIPNADFSDTLTRGINDLQVWLSSSCPVPGDTILLMAGAFNNGTTTADSPVVVILDPNTSFVASIPAPTSVSGDTLIYNVHLLSDSFATFNIFVGVAPTVMAGDTLKFSATSSFPDNVVPSDDTAVYNRVVHSSYDPNFIAVNQPLFFHRNNTMIYTVNFQNTGNYKAKNIVVLDTFDAKVDPATFKFIGSTAATPPVITWMSGNRVYFNFHNINLPDSASNPAGSHGSFTYAIRTRSTVALGDTVHNTGYIYFDYNAPVQTNITTNILAAPSVVNSVAAVLQRGDITLYPNPSQGHITIHTPAADDWQVAVTDVTGRVLSTATYHAQAIDLQPATTPGIYFVTITNTATQARVTKKVVITD